MDAKTLTLRLQRLTDSSTDRDAVEAVIMAAADYNLLIEGVPPNAGHVDDFFTGVPPGYTVDQLVLMGFWCGDDVAGVASLLNGWNAPHKVHIGLLLFAPAFRGRGLGRMAGNLIEQHILATTEATCVRIAVIANNHAAFAFWRKIGFVETGEVKLRFAPFVDDVVVLEKPLARLEAA